MTDANYWRDVQKRMAAGGAYDHGVMDSHLVDPPGPDAWDECGYCGHDRDDHWSDGCNVPFRHPGGLIGICTCPGFQEPS